MHVVRFERVHDSYHSPDNEIMSWGIGAVRQQTQEIIVISQLGCVFPDRRRGLQRRGKERQVAQVLVVSSRQEHLGVLDLDVWISAPFPERRPPPVLGRVLESAEAAEVTELLEGGLPVLLHIHFQPDSDVLVGIRRIVDKMDPSGSGGGRRMVCG